MTTAARNLDGYTLEEWHAAANAECLRLCGLTIDDMPDVPIWDMWADSLPPRECAEVAIIEGGGGFILE